MANQAEFAVMQAWNREVITDARARLPLRVPEPEVLPEPEPQPEDHQPQTSR